MIPNDSLEEFLRPKNIHGNSSLLHEAIIYDALACFKAILQSGINSIWLNLPDKTGSTCLHIAAEKTSIKYLELLLQHNVNVNARDNDGNTALHVLLEDYKKETRENKIKIRKCIQILINDPNTDISAVNASNVSVHYMIRHDERLSEMLMDREIEQVTQMSANNWLMNISNSLVSQNNVRLRSELFEIKSKKLITNVDDYYLGSQSFLCYAIKYHSMEVVEVLLDCGASPVRLTLENKLPLHLALARGSPEITSLLLKRMACKTGKVDLRDHSFSILQEALKSIELASANATEYANCIACLASLFKENVEINVNKMDVSDTDDKGKIVTPLHIAASINSQEAMKILLMNGASLLEPRHQNDNEGNYVLSFLECDTLCDAMNGCVTAPKKSNPDKQTLELDYQFLLPRKHDDKKGERTFSISKSVNVAHRVLKITREPGYKKFIKHPLMKALLETKWGAVRLSFLLNLWLSISFHVVFLSFLLLLNTNILMTQMSNNSTNNMNEDLVLNSGWFDVVFTICDVLLLPLLLYFLAREILLLATTKYRYFTHFENYLQVTVFILAFILSFIPLGFGTLKHLTAWGLILGW